MKKILTALLLVCGFIGKAQYNPSIHFPVVSDAIGVSQATPTDARSMFFNTSTFTYRNYANRAEANTYLNLAKYRSGRFSIYIDSAGHTYEYYYRDCTNDTCLVLKSNAAVNMDSVLFAPNYRVDTAKVNLRNSIAGKISTTLPIAQILVGNPSSIATPVTVTNDASITSGGSVTVKNQWKLIGNAGTSPGTNFIGTTDGQALAFKVNNSIAGKLQISGGTSFGYLAGQTDPYSTAIGYNALASGAVNSDFNTAVGYMALTATTTGQLNTGVGHEALLHNTTGYNNVGIGPFAISNNTIGAFNTAIGYDALQALRTTSYNTVVGFQAGFNIQTGTGNVVLGSDSSGLMPLTTGSYNTIIGGNIQGISSSLWKNIILADGQGNQRLNIDSFGTSILTSTTALGLPSGNTAQRPSSPIAGYTRYNTDSAKVEFYNGSVWATFSNGGSSGSGITLLNGLSSVTQLFAIGTSGATPNISSVSNTHTFNFPLSGTHARGVLDSTDWITFNGKLSNITGLVTAGTNITVTGLGTSGSPYVVTATAGSGINQLNGDVLAGPGIGNQTATISSNAVTTTKINNNAVTLAKQATNTSNTLQGFDGSGNASDITLTTTGSSGAATISGGVLNIPQYSGGGGTNNLGRFTYSTTNPQLIMQDTTRYNRFGEDNVKFGGQSLLISDTTGNFNPEYVVFEKGIGGSGTVPSGGHAMKGRFYVGPLGSKEFNTSIFMYYRNQIHLSDDTTEDVIWSAMSNRGLFVQAVAAPNYNNQSDIWVQTHTQEPLEIFFRKNNQGNYMSGMLSHYAETYRLRDRQNNDSLAQFPTASLFDDARVLKVDSAIENVNLPGLRLYYPGNQAVPVVEAGSGVDALTIRGTGINTSLYLSNIDNNSNFVETNYIKKKGSSFALGSGVYFHRNNYNGGQAYDGVVSNGNFAAGGQNAEFFWTTTNPGGTTAERMRLTDSGHLKVNGLIESTTLGVKFPDGSIQTTAFVGGGSFYTTDGSLTSNRHVTNAGNLLTFDQMQIGNTTQFDASYILQLWNPSSATRLGLNDNESNGNGNEIRFNKRRSGSYTLTNGDLIGDLDFNTIGTFSAVANSHTISGFTNFDYVWTMGAVTTGVTTQAMRLTDSFHLKVAGMIESQAYGFKFPDGTVQITAATGGGTPDTLHVVKAGTGTQIGYTNGADTLFLKAITNVIQNNDSSLTVKTLQEADQTLTGNRTVTFGSDNLTFAATSTGLFKINGSKIGNSGSGYTVIVKNPDSSIAQVPISTLLTDGLVTSGTYTPTLTNGTNVASSVAQPCHWWRVGNQISVTGILTATATLTATNTVIDISLPVATGMAATTDLSGVMTSSAIAGLSGGIEGNLSSDIARLTYTAVGTGSDKLFFHLTYTFSAP